MARYVVHVRTSMPRAEAFAYMADLTNFAKWDPGVDRVVQFEGNGAGIGDRAAAGLVEALSGERVRT